MADKQPQFAQINLVVRDMDASVAFYRLLGLDISVPDRDWLPGSGALHTEVVMDNGTRFELDNVAMAQLWHEGLRPLLHGVGTVIGFDVESREAVDARYAEITEAGHKGRQAPCEAFWGARYAIVEDPDGNEVGLMSPVDRDRAFTPEV
jgi:catechol 2,3-dioxygenase-like lactoylglutathione lyase family enzyme